MDAKTFLNNKLTEKRQHLHQLNIEYDNATESKDIEAIEQDSQRAYFEEKFLVQLLKELDE